MEPRSTVWIESVVFFDYGFGILRAESAAKSKGEYR
jgi:hypothetical protein